MLVGLDSLINLRMKFDRFLNTIIQAASFKIVHMCKKKNFRTVLSKILGAT
jgi:hypothetical protein